MSKQAITSEEYNARIRIIEDLKLELENYEVVDSWEGTEDERVFTSEGYNLTLSANTDNWVTAKKAMGGNIFYINIDNEWDNYNASMSFDKEIAENLVSYLIEKLKYLEGDD